MRKLNSAELKVLDAYKKNPLIVNSDKDLIPFIWREERWSDRLDLEANFKRVTNPESITRARRKLHELGHIKYSKEALNRRTEEFKTHRDENSEPVMLFNQPRVNSHNPFLER